MVANNYLEYGLYERRQTLEWAGTVFLVCMHRAVVHLSDDRHSLRDHIPPARELKSKKSFMQSFKPLI